MKNAIADTRNQAPKHNSSLIADVKKAIQLALDESGWSHNGRNKKPRATILEDKKVEGGSGMHWTVDLAVTDGKEELYMVVFCIDFRESVHFENALIRAAAVFQDLYVADGMMVLVVRKDNETHDNKSLPMGYDQLFAGIHVDVLEWNPKQAFELVMDLSLCLRRRHHNMHGVKSIRETVGNLIEKYPELFVDNRRIPKKTDCLELLQQIKEHDFHQNFGEIIKDVLSQEGICQSLIGSRLRSISDTRFEKLLKQYLEQQK